MNEITMASLKEKLKTEYLDLIDIRDHYLYERGTISGAVNIPYRMLKMYPEKYLLKEGEYYLFCETGAISARLATELVQKGYRVINVKEGYEIF